MLLLSVSALKHISSIIHQHRVNKSNVGGEIPSHCCSVSHCGTETLWETDRMLVKVKPQLQRRQQHNYHPTSQNKVTQTVSDSSGIKPKLALIKPEDQSWYPGQTGSMKQTGSSQEADSKLRGNRQISPETPAAEDKYNLPQIHHVSKSVCVYVRASSVRERLYKFTDGVNIQLHTHTHTNI